MSRRISLLLGVSVVAALCPYVSSKAGRQWLADAGNHCSVAGGQCWRLLSRARHLLRAHALLLGAAASTPTAGGGGEPAAAADHVVRRPAGTGGHPDGLAAGIAAILYTAVVPGVLAGAGLAPELPWIYAAVLTSLAALAALISWSAVNALLELAETALLGLERAQVDVDEARSQRLELKQVEEDLLQATREQARLLERLKAMNQIAEEARQSKQEFIAKVSHELRTPLNMIIAYSELITQSPKLYGGRIPPALLADMAVILRNSQHLSKLVDDVLDLSQIDAGRMALSKSWVDLRAIAARGCRGSAPAVPNQGPLSGSGRSGEPAAGLL